MFRRPAAVGLTCLSLHLKLMARKNGSDNLDMDDTAISWQFPAGLPATRLGMSILPTAQWEMLSLRLIMASGG